jgi:hypothetical protein
LVRSRPRSGSRRRRTSRRRTTRRSEGGGRTLRRAIVDPVKPNGLARFGPQSGFTLTRAIETVTEVLRRANRPLRVIEVRIAAEELLRRPLNASSVNSTLRRGNSLDSDELRTVAIDSRDLPPQHPDSRAAPHCARHLPGAVEAGRGSADAERRGLIIRCADSSIRRRGVGRPLLRDDRVRRSCGRTRCAERRRRHRCKC